jgi:hypothetical protein
MCHVAVVPNKERWTNSTNICHTRRLTNSSSMCHRAVVPYKEKWTNSTNVCHRPAVPHKEKRTNSINICHRRRWTNSTSMWHRGVVPYKESGQTAQMCATQGIADKQQKNMPHKEVDKQHKYVPYKEKRTNSTNVCHTRRVQKAQLCATQVGGQRAQMCATKGLCPTRRSGRTARSPDSNRQPAEIRTRYFDTHSQRTPRRSAFILPLRMAPPQCATPSLHGYR